MVRFVPRVPYRDIPEETAVRPQDVVRPGPLAQLGPLHGPGLPAESPPDRAQEIPGREETVACEAAGETNADIMVTR